MKLSVIVPVYNEEEVIEKFYQVTKNELKNIDFDLIIINDGSNDKSLEILKRISSKDNKVKIVSFSRNFGKEAAIYAGLNNSDGDYTCIIDADLQQNPKYLKKMYNFLEKNKDYDCVCMCQEKRKENIIYKLCKNVFYSFIDKMADVNFVSDASDFRMFNKKMLNALLKLSENNRFSKGLFSWVGFNVKYMPYVVEDRKAGRSKWKISSLFSYAIDGFVGFSTKPLKISTFIGCITSLVAFIYLLIIIIETLAFGKDTPGYASIMCVILFLGGIQLICIGIVGEYLSKTYLETKKRPIYVEKEKINFDDSEK